MLRTTAPVQHEHIFQFIDPSLSALMLSPSTRFPFGTLMSLKAFAILPPAFGIRLCPLPRPHYRWTENL